MSDRIKFSTSTEQLKEGLFGQVFLYVFEILPYLDSQGILPAWAIRSTLYGMPKDYVVIPGLLEMNYETDAGNYREVNLQDLRDRHAVTLGSDWDYNAGLWNKYFRWPQRVIRRAAEFPALHGALGIHYRGTDKNTSLKETNYVSPENFLTLVRDFIGTHRDVETIYVATDEDAFVDKVRAQHPSLRVIYSGAVTHHKSGAVEDNFAKGDHALLDCWLLSRCRYLIKCQSALSGFAKILNPKLEAYRVSANILWSWGLPYFPDAYIPKLESQNPECQKILAALQAGDWTEDKTAMKKFGGQFRYKPRKGYIRKERGVPKWSFDGLQQRFDLRLARLVRRLGN